ncbi:cytochrome b561 [Pasteurella testudinis DSM 23072]|uniref:Cytochrome b561 n=1 Tax=Pasteurella testudinis DSM 23072 TaxID=1122938 RepID=A0A1W1VA15_9PAST|nr:cytochrome b [Pasteurella testudinis]SMB90249.1 cytochrome b561 [Pasteurella testudinis DSM 23072]SUB51367.1 Cytochrome b561 homolog 2 [Pasteurella testudinis]
MSSKMKDTRERFSHITLSLHWLIAIFIIGLMALGVYMGETASYGLYPTHKSLGIFIFIFIVIRVLWRWKNGWPQPAGKHSGWEQALAKLIHWILILGTLAFPISGMLMSYAGGHGLQLFGLDLVSANLVDGKREVLNAALAGSANAVHKSLLPIMTAAILLHIAGALKHHVIDKDNTLKRMFGFKNNA